MAFAKLFSGLSAVDEDVRSPPAFTHRDHGDARKRKTQGDQPGPDNKKQRCQAQTSRTYNTAGHNNVHGNGQNNKTKNYCKANTEQQQKKKKKRKKNQQWNGGGHHQTRATLRNGGGDGKHKNGKQHVQVKQKRFMSQEFKDQNAVLMDGLLVCRHFLWGRCIKGEDCQLKHIQGCNDLIKEVCKFYVQGFCTKGESCPYMHKSFPCKFFHRKSACSQGADCRFSHEPLDELTTRLLDEAIKREHDLCEIARKAQQESSGPPANADESETSEANRTPDILIQPLRPTFYNSGKTNAEEEDSLQQTEELPDVRETDAPPQAPESAQPRSPLSAVNLNHAEPVCYSVEAVLGSQLFRPFPSYFTTPASQEAAPLSAQDASSHHTSGSADQSEDPSSVDPVKSCKSAANSSSGHTPTPPTKTDSEEIFPPSLQTEKVFHPLNKSQEKMFKSLPSLQTHTDLISETNLEIDLASADHNKHKNAKTPAFLRPVQRASHEVKCEPLHSPAAVSEKSASSKSKGALPGSTHLPMDMTNLANCKREGTLPFAPTKLKSLTSAPEHPTQSKPRLFGQTLSSPASVKLPSSLFASPITDSLKTKPDSIKTSACPQPSCPTLQTTEQCRSEDVQVEPDAATARPFLSLFAAPLGAAPLPCVQSQLEYSRTSSWSRELNPSPDNTSHSSDSKQRALNFETPPPRRLRTDAKQTPHRPTSPKRSLGTRHENYLPELGNRPTKQEVCRLMSDSLSDMSSSPTHPCGDGEDPPMAQAHQQLPNISSSKGSAVASAANSRLKTLFVSLSPYQQDGNQEDRAQISVSPDGEKKAKSSTGCVSVKQQQKSKKKRRRRKKLKAQPSHQQSAENAAAHSPKRQPTGEPTLDGPDVTEPQLTNSGTRNLLFKPVTQPQLKDLFKTLDTTVFHFGH